MISRFNVMKHGIKCKVMVKIMLEWNHAALLKTATVAYFYMSVAF